MGNFQMFETASEGVIVAARLRRSCITRMFVGWVFSAYILNTTVEAALLANGRPIGLDLLSTQHI